jgi:hypothetical protein
MQLRISDQGNYNDNVQAYDFESLGFNPGDSVPEDSTLRVSNPALQPEVFFTIELPSYVNYAS